MLKYFFILSLILFSTTSFAASVTAVKGQKVLISMDGDLIQEGEEFFLINPSSRKRTAIIRIKQIKGDKALGDILKGSATAGHTLQAKASSTSISRDVAPGGDTAATTSEKFTLPLRPSYGLVGGYIQNSMTATVSYKDGFGVTQKSEAAMSGSGFAVGGFYDHVFTQSLVGRGYVGLEQFNATTTIDTSACTNSTTCDAKINYLSFYGLGKWYPWQGQYRPWLGGGVGYLYAVSKSSTALKDVSGNQVFTLALGADIQKDRRNYIPISLEYNMFQSTSTVKANMILLKIGWAWAAK
ncbi:MAG: hypothetical protein AAGB31_05435 [Bdellovibrio sp.]